MSIKLLDKNVINQISAGEVVEKPASIVKEIVENSIDANATEITIEIKGGGIDYIMVTDNGCGIDENEVELAFTPHATSKLSNIDDLNTLSTMGFRGEALATISAVSKVTMITKTKDNDTATQITLQGGETIDIKKIASVNGTKIEVRDVFFNTPARLKFLRKPKTEENDITSYIEKLILANPEISFKYIIDGKMIYNTISGSIIDNIYTIYGKDLANNMLEVDYSFNEYSVKGYICKPEFSKSNRTYQTLFVNSRFCTNALVSTAVSNAFENFMMKGKFPVYVLYLSLPQNKLDVNVHPNKLEVKFENTSAIYRVINDAVFKALSDFTHIRKVDFNEANDNEELSYSTDKFYSQSEKLTEKSLSDENINSTQNNTNSIILDNEGVSYQKNSNLNYEKAIKEYTENVDYLKNSKSGSFDFNLTNSILPQVDIFESNNIKSVKGEVIDNNLSKNIIKINDQTNFKEILENNYRLVGIIFNTYLIIEYEDKMFMIDQHASHERKKYDEIILAIKDNNLQLQDLLAPYILKVNQNEATFLNDNLLNLQSFGIDIQEFGYNTYKISSVPVILSNISLQDFFDEILQNLNSLIKSPQETLKSRFMQLACKSAIKGGDKLSDIEIKELLKQIKENKSVLLCPHGRPIVVEITKNQIEKWFKRIV